jgi:predicted DNA-binding transcriptional regulator YafY
MVEAWSDQGLARHARSALAKAETAMHEKLRDRLREVEVYVPSFHMPEALTLNLEPLREAIGSKRKVRFGYVNQSGEQTERVVRPLGLFFWGRAWTAVAWCELRSDFRSFRPDRMLDLEVLDEPIPDEQDRDLDTFLRWVQRDQRTW